MQSRTLIQPYELLGVATNSTVKEVRKAYYQLALLCHPDKGGDPNDMRMIQTAYEWVMAQISKIDLSYTYEIAQQEFDDFVAAQNKNAAILPSFTDVLMESNGLNEKQIRDWYTNTGKDPEKYVWFQRFLWQELLAENTKHCTFDDFERAYQRLQESLRSMTNMSIPHGYGSYMDEPVHDTAIKKFPSKELIIYTEQKPFTQHKGVLADIDLPTEIDDYSTMCASLQGYDYSLAFTDQDPFLEKELEELCSQFVANTLSIDDALSKVRQERDMYAQEN